MGCSWLGVGALVVLLATAVLSMVALILPMWSMSDSVNPSLFDKLTRADFAAGLWGFCIDVELFGSAANGSQTLNHCYFFHTPTSYNLTAIAPSLAANFADLSVCNGFQESWATGVEPHEAYAVMLASVTGINATSFAKFLDETSVIILVGRVLVAVASLATTLTFILWLVQSRMLNDEDDVALGVSFELAVSAAVLYLVSMALVAAFKDNFDELDLVWAGPLYVLVAWE